MLHNAFYRLSGAESMLSSYAAMQGSKQWRLTALESFKQREQQLMAGLAALGLDGKVRRMDHHLSHAANAVLSSVISSGVLSPPAFFPRVTALTVSTAGPNSKT